MNFECPECKGSLTLPGSIFETCAECGYCSETRLTQVNGLIRKINIHTTRIAKLEAALRKLVDKIELHSDWFEELAEGTGCSCGNPDGGSLVDCEHCGFLCAAHELSSVIGVSLEALGHNE